MTFSLNDHEDNTTLDHLNTSLYEKAKREDYSSLSFIDC